jgi:signal recognition particle subunit SRP54
MGVGEKIDQFQAFDPKRIADRILDRGDIVSLVEKAATSIDQDEAEAMALKMQKGTFNLNDLAKYLQQMLKMGGISSLIGFLPGMGKIKEQLNDIKGKDQIIHRQIGIIRSMTPKERANPKILNGSRRKRIAAGSGVEVSDVNKLLKQFEQLANVMKKMKQMSGKGFLRGGLGNLLGPR